jgi:putative flippase GtrA
VYVTLTAWVVEPIIGPADFAEQIVGVEHGLTDYRPQILRQVFRHLQVGLAGFLTDIGMLALLIYQAGFGSTDAGLVGSRVVAFVGAISVTFMLNARYTFWTSVRDASFTAYLLIQILGAVINLGSYTVLIFSGLLNHAPLIALAIGSALATTTNFILARRFIYQ